MAETSTLFMLNFGDGWPTVEELYEFADTALVMHNLATGGSKIIEISADQIQIEFS